MVSWRRNQAQNKASTFDLANPTLQVSYGSFSTFARRHRAGNTAKSAKSEIWLRFLNTVRTERFDQVLAIKALLPAIARAA